MRPPMASTHEGDCGAAHCDTPRASARIPPHTSPHTSPRTSPHTSPRESPRESALTSERAARDADGWRISANGLRAAVSLSLLLLLCAAGAAQAATATRISRIALTVADVGRSERFYRDGLGFKQVSTQLLDDPAYAQLYGVPHARIHVVIMQLGDEQIEFDQFDRRGQAYPRDSRSEDRWFQHFAIVVGDMDRAYAQLHKLHPIAISRGGPQTLPPATGSVSAYKFRDPDGHPLELIHFPAGQGRSRWHDADTTGRVFLGIDHSAIGVADSARSLAFYTHLLGLTQAYRSLNEGPTQVALDGAFNATVRITGLRPPDAHGAGVELLDYRAPDDGRSSVLPAHSNDIADTRLRFDVDDLDAISNALLDADVPFVSPRRVALPDGRQAAIIVRDPDGHAIELVQ